MVKKKGVVGKLEYKEFSEWKSAINEMQKANLRVELSGMEYKLMQKDMELLNLKMQLMAKNKLEPCKEFADLQKVEYDRIKTELEGKLGYSLNDKAIDEVTLEVKDLSKIT